MPYSAPSPSGIHIEVVEYLADEAQAMRRALVASEKASIEECYACLQRAAAVYQDTFRAFEYRQGLTDPGPLRRRLIALRWDLAAVAQLARSGLTLSQGMLRLFGTASGGYTAGGEGAPLKGSVGVLIRG